ncbi:MAG: FAD-binding oxidoreductase [Parachlamydiales bacterium]|nr:FAD-binding oxidoreductase [Parachlamydiales bacterium]
MSPFAEYEKKKGEIVEEFRKNARENGTFSLKKDTSNLFRNRVNKSKKLDVKRLNRVISIDPVHRIAEIEAMTTFEDLVNETLKTQLLPPVVPELKTITVGGALVGLGIESSSFRYGLVHETILEIEVLTGDGRVLICRPDNEHRDLFLAFPNSYGTLGIALKVKMKLIPAKPYVRITNEKFDRVETFFARMHELCAKNRSDETHSYIDGVIFSPNEQYIIQGEFTDEAPYLSNYKYLNIYYQSIRQKKENYLTTLDYIWRWDTDWFWCSKHFGMQNPLMRLLFGKFALNSKFYWKIKRLVFVNPIVKALVKLFEKPTESVIQDILIPIQNAAEFHNYLQKTIAVSPIWICPYYVYNTEEYAFCQFDPSQFYVDFGFWDMIPSTKPKGHFNRLIEQKADELNGYKSLYSDSYYTEEKFWQIHSKQAFLKVKHKYDPEKSFKDLYEKCVAR